MQISSSSVRSLAELPRSGGGGGEGMGSYFANVLLIIALLPHLAGAAINITDILSPFPDLSAFNSLLAATPVPAEIAGRSSLTLLAVPNSYLFRPASAADDIADVLRYHVLLEYLSWDDLNSIPASGKLVTTLYQTTGRATADSGAVNLTRSADGAATTFTARLRGRNATVVAPVASLPYDVSVLAVDALFFPCCATELAASATASAPAVNITAALADGKDFNVAAAMLVASGVVEEFEADESGAGITVFVPTDEAFAAAPEMEMLQSLPAADKDTVLRFHVLHSYYPLGSLESMVNPVQPTVATEDAGAGRFTLNITRMNSSVAIDTGVVKAIITRTVFDRSPVAIFAVSKVLLPMEIFMGSSPAVRKGDERALPPAVAPAGGVAPIDDGNVDDDPSSRLSSPPGIKRDDDVKPVSASRRRHSVAVPAMLFSVAMLYLILGI